MVGEIIALLVELHYNKFVNRAIGKNQTMIGSAFHLSSSDTLRLSRKDHTLLLHDINLLVDTLVRTEFLR